MFITKPQDPQVTDRLEQSTDRVCRREGKLTGIVIIGVSIVVVSILGVVRQHLPPNADIWLLGLVIPTWFAIYCLRQYRRE
jgi:hypothetical protein